MQLALPLPELSIPADEAYPPPLARRVFCNRSLRLDHIEMVGFDMDYTLAVYKQAEIDRLSIEATTRKLVELGYPSQLLHMRYRTDFPIRGLLIDRRLGNVLKMDRYRYVKKAYHGMRELSREERRHLYHTKRLRPGSRRYHWVDTLYGLSEVSVFAAVIEALEQEGEHVEYDQLFSDVRASIDAAHRDGSILDEVAADLPRYVERDPDLGPTLHTLRSSGKRLFLLTNSQPAYTEQMMSHLLDGAMPEYPSWKNYFDLIVTAACKPRFFTEKAPFREWTEEGEREVTELERGRIHMGGNIEDFEHLTGATGDKVLYVGDHIYGDALRVKKDSAWRTAMILQEMTDELDALERCNEELTRLDALEDLRDRLSDELRERQMRVKAIDRRLQDTSDGNGADPELQAARLRHRRAIDKLRMRLRTVGREHNELEDQTDLAFHPFWGSLFKAGSETSSFGDQVEVYACLYTTRVSNLRWYSPMHYFRSPRDRMPHEM
jgi:HAD superfamily 5'-nucleotidase-like hydrolase